MTFNEAFYIARDIKARGIYTYKIPDKYIKMSDLLKEYEYYLDYCESIDPDENWGGYTNMPNFNEFLADKYDFELDIDQERIHYYYIKRNNRSDLMLTDSAIIREPWRVIK